MADQTSTPASTTATPKPDKPPEPKWLFYILSAFFYGIVGIVLGIIYMKKASEESKKFGKICLTVGIVFMAIPCVCTLIWFIFYGGLTILGLGGAATQSTSSY